MGNSSRHWAVRDGCGGSSQGSPIGRAWLWARCSIRGDCMERGGHCLDRAGYWDAWTRWLRHSCLDRSTQRRRTICVDVDGCSVAGSPQGIVPLSRRQTKFGTLQRDLSPLKDAIDYRLTKWPSLYLFVERFREWVNWDKRVYLSFVRPGDAVLDVGANVGAHCVFLSHMVRAPGRV